MDFLENLLIVIYVIISIAIIALAIMQAKKDEGLSGAIMGGGGGSSFYEKNKGRTKEGKLKRWTIVLGIIFAVLTIVLGIVYMM